MHMITATPIRQIAVPARSNRSSLNPSTTVPHANYPGTKMLPCAAKIRPKFASG